MFRRFLGSSGPPAESLAALTPVERQSHLLHASKGLEMVMNDQNIEAGKVLESSKDAFHLTGLAVSVFVRAMLSFQKADIAASAVHLEQALAACETEMSYAKEVPGSKFPVGAEFNVCTALTSLLLAITGFMSDSITEAMKSVFKLRRAYQILYALHAHMEAKSITLTGFQGRATPEDPSSSLSDTTMVNRLHRVDTRHMERALGPKSDLNTTDYFIACTTLCGHGTLSLMISLMPPAVSRLLSVIGFRGNKSEALANLRSVARAPNFQGSLALIVLLSFQGEAVGSCDIVQNELKQLQELNTILQLTIERYPNSSVWQLMAGQMQQRLGNAAGGIKTLQGICTQDDMKQLETLKHHELGFAHLFCLDWQAAADNLITVVDQNDWSKALYFYVVGACFFELYCDTGEQGYADKAELYWMKVPGETGKKKILGKEIPMECFFRRKITKWRSRSDGKSLITGITVSPMMEFSHLFNLWKKMAPELRPRALQRVQRPGVSRDSEDDKITRVVMTTALQRAAGNWDAFETIAVASSLPRNHFRDIPHAETWALPFAQYEHGACFWARDGMDGEKDVRYWIEKAKNFGDSELESRLSIKISIALETLNTSKK